MTTDDLVNSSARLAIIYSLDDLFVYTVEIKEGDTRYYLMQGDDPILFANIQDAKRAALKENIQQAYLALSKTYDEIGMATVAEGRHDKYEYSPIAL